VADIDIDALDLHDLDGKPITEASQEAESIEIERETA
jgi:hypothetical protein